LERTNILFVRQQVGNVVKSLDDEPWAPAGICKRGHLPLWKCFKVFCALVVTAKRS